MSQTIVETCRLVTDPSGCYVEEPLSNAAIAEFALEPMVKRVGSNPRQREPELRLRPMLARLRGGKVFGLTFVPVTQDGFASLNFFVHNPMNLNKIINGEDPEGVDFAKKICCRASSQESTTTTLGFWSGIRETSGTGCLIIFRDWR
jgi:hypothetical protein